VPRVEPAMVCMAKAGIAADVGFGDRVGHRLSPARSMTERWGGLHLL
jgi:hypothetical protein